MIQSNAASPSRRLLQDYDQLPLMLVGVRNRDELDVIRSEPAVANAQVEGQKETTQQADR